MTTYRVWCPYDGETVDDSRRIEASSSSSAAKIWARLDDADGDYRIVAGTDIDVHVREAHVDGVERVYRVSGESVPEYSAREVKP
jgi:hypothetical protein